ncbi:MAG: bifunctional folylpolyglutamate synthase/dihydrofolate synthase [Thermoanaerobaculia bacterium]
MTTFPALERLESLSPRGMKLGLAAIGSVCERLAHPERRVPSVLVAGTNGKGSTAATLASIAAASGVRAGLYTSPHLIHVTERIRVEGDDITEEELDVALARVFAAADAAPQVPLTYFEAFTAAAFAVFAERRLELSVLEVGLGGRLDATNVAPACLSVVTSIGLDHTEELGSSLPAIAREKAGIFRSGRPALGLAATAEAVEALRESAEATGAIWHDAAREISVSGCEVGLAGTRFTLETRQRRLQLSTPLPGEHQAWNAALAVRSAELLAEPRLSLDASSLARGVAAVRWPGRLERFQARGRTVLLDGCHNPEGAQALGRFLEEAGLEGKCTLLFGAMVDKDVEEIARLLFPKAGSVRLVAAPSARAATPAELLRRVSPVRPDALPGGDLKSELGKLLAQENAAPIIVAGSLYLVGEARALLLAGKFEEGLS